MKVVSDVNYSLLKCVTLRLDWGPVDLTLGAEGGDCCLGYRCALPCPPAYPQHLQRSRRRVQQACQTVTGPVGPLRFSVSGMTHTLNNTAMGAWATRNSTRTCNRCVQILGPYCFIPDMMTVQKRQCLLSPLFLCSVDTHMDASLCNKVASHACMDGCTRCEYLKLQIQMPGLI